MVVFPLLGLILLLVGLWVLAMQPQAVRLTEEGWVADSGRYAGVEACRDCHAAIVEEQLASNHAQTVRSLVREPPRGAIGNGQEVLDPLTGARYATETQAGIPHLTLSVGALRAREPLDWEFGAGTHAFGYLAHLDDGTWVDTRVNYYSQLKKWDFTSSQDKPAKHLLAQPLGRPRSSDEVLRCFACHGTVIRAEGTRQGPAGTPLDPARMKVRPDRSVLNVTCESCHGPRAEHVAAFRSGKPDAPKQNWAAKEMNDLCGKCHGFTDIEASHPVIARFQPWGLDQSRCFRESRGKMSCSSCHDPHQNARRDRPFYEAKCRGCHSGAAGSIGKTLCPKGRTTGCVSCHMPTDSKSMLHVSFTDHRIRVLKAEAQRVRSSP